MFQKVFFFLLLTVVKIMIYSHYDFFLVLHDMSSIFATNVENYFLLPIEQLLKHHEFYLHIVVLLEIN